MALWGGRFSQQPADAVFALSRSVHFDWRLAPYDLRSSLAHLAILESSGLLDASVAKSIRGALNELISEVASGKFVAIATDEDVHSALERGLTDKLGAIGGSLRAGRSRNDQVATDLRLYAIDHMIEVAQQLLALQNALIAKASEYGDAPAPGFTHLQHAQPVLFGHEIAKHVQGFSRDLDRIHDWLDRALVSPLGSGALAGSSLPIDPDFTAKEMGFAEAFGNSLDAVSDRDFVAEALFNLALIGTHLSRLGEEWVLWTTEEFGFATLDDRYATGSSMLPQKKNADIAELARGKTGRLIGNLTGLLTTLKGLPLAYNRDLQEDKEPLFDSYDQVTRAIAALSGMISTASFNADNMRRAADSQLLAATDLAEWLVRKGTPFRQAHAMVGALVQRAISGEKSLRDLVAHDELFGDEAARLIGDGIGVRQRTSPGASGPAAASLQIERYEALIASLRSRATI
jgi:argininosuccinate lyase